jgi:hypothetical protein
MFILHAVQAQFGDALILEFGTQPDRHFILIDGGPADIFADHLRTALKDVVGEGGALDLMILSHVDTDHAIGLLDLVAELRDQRANNQTELVSIGAVWHNSFARTLGDGTDIQARVASAMQKAQAAGASLSHGGAAFLGIQEGHELRMAVKALGRPINPGFPNDLIIVDTAPNVLAFGSLSLRIVGPTQKNLDALKTQWLAWLDTHEDDFDSGNPMVMAMADRSIPNLSSIQVLAEADGKRLLLTGDGRGDHLLNGLEQAGLLDQNGAMHVDVLKLAHHGSDRNVNRKFFTRVTADTYVASADGKDGNPDFATLEWIVETAHDAGRKIAIVATNETPSIEKLGEEYDVQEFGYKLKIMARNKHSIAVKMA